MKFIVDTQLSPKLSKYIASLGFDCIHTTHFANGHLLKDSQIITIAKEQDRIIITKDIDFSDYFFIKGAPPKILLLLFGNMSNKTLIEYFDRYFKLIVKQFESNVEYIQFGKNGIVSSNL